jgi:hypothetical protein
MSGEKSPEHKALRKVVIFAVFLPLMLYAFPTSINNIFGIDLTGGWMGERDPVGAGYVVVLGSPIYVYHFFRSVSDYISMKKNQSR